MQQKILLARWLELPVRLLLLEEPTRGVDVQTKSDLYRLVRGLGEKGAAVVWWSTEHAELLAVSDQVLTFTLSGRPGELFRAHATDEDTLVTATGTA
jgi:ribose transport system ATP-binding protein